MKQRISETLLNGQSEQQSTSPVCPPIDITDINALEALAMEELVAIVQTAPRSISKIPAVKELLDRVKGKAPQSIAMTVKAEPVSRLTDDQLAAILANLPNSPMVIPPMPKKLDVD